jgi:hypothetical protein
MVDRSRSSGRSSTRAETCQWLQQRSRETAAAVRAPDGASREGGGEGAVSEYGDNEQYKCISTENMMQNWPNKTMQLVAAAGGGRAPAKWAKAAAGTSPSTPQRSAHLDTSVYQAAQCPESVLRSGARTRTARALPWMHLQPTYLAATGAETEGRRRQHGVHPA